MPNFKKQKIKTNVCEKILKNQEKSNKREKNSWNNKYLKYGKREFKEKLISEKGNKETDIKIKQHQNLIKEKSWRKRNKHPNNQEVNPKKKYRKIRNKS